MVEFVEAVRDGIRGVQCALLNDNEDFVNAIGRFSGPVRQRALDGINATRRLLGCDPAEDPEEPPPPFTGGQCEGQLYTVQVAGPSTPPGGSGVATRIVPGPVGGMCFPAASGGNVRIGVIGSTGCVTSGGGQGLTVPSVQGQWEIVSVTPVSGTDDCGDPPPVFGPPAPRPIDIDITFQPDFGPEITVPITFNFNPVEIDFNGNFRFPFDFDFGGFNFNGDVNFAPEINVRINPPRANPGDGEDLDDQGEDEPGETVPPAEPDQKIIGVVVTATDVESTRVSQIFNPGMTPTYAPRLGSVKFAYSLGGATFFSSDIDIKDRRTFIECPFSQGADAAIASPQPGIELTFTEIRGFPLATVRDIQSSTPAP